MEVTNICLKIKKIKKYQKKYCEANRSKKLNFYRFNNVCYVFFGVFYVCFLYIIKSVIFMSSRKTNGEKQ